MRYLFIAVLLSTIGCDFDELGTSTAQDEVSLDGSFVEPVSGLYAGQYEPIGFICPDLGTLSLPFYTSVLVFDDSDVPFDGIMFKFLYKPFELWMIELPVTCALYGDEFLCRHFDKIDGSNEHGSYHLTTRRVITGKWDENGGTLGFSMSIAFRRYCNGSGCAGDVADDCSWTGRIRAHHRPGG